MRYTWMLFLIFITTAAAQEMNCNGQWYEGEGTHYGGIAGGAGGHCGIPVETGDIYHAAMNHEQYAGSQACGACVRVLGPKGQAILKIADECPECKFGDIDVTTAVFPHLAELKDGRIKIKWQYVPCPQTGDIKILFAPGSGPYYFKAQIRDMYYQVSSLEYKKKDGSYSTISREVYNYFVEMAGIDEDKSQAGPYTFRITSVTGQIVYLENIPLTFNEPVSTGMQFAGLECPDCKGDSGGTAIVDNCGVCSGGNSGTIPNSTCSKDCNDYWEGTAYKDACGKCVAGTTGATPCDSDCSGQPGGSAYIDNCKNCVEGNTGKIPCKKDCINEWGGKAYSDSCGMCAGGNTGRTPVLTNSACVTGINYDSKSEETENAVFPNPFKDEIHIKASEYVEIRICNILGEEVWKGISRENIPSTEHLAPGSYLLTISIREKTKTIIIFKL